MDLVRSEDGAGRLVKISGSFGRSKTVTIKFYGGYTYLHICSQTSKAKISVGVDEYLQLLDMVDKATVDRINQAFKEQAVEENNDAERAAEAALELPIVAPRRGAAPEAGPSGRPGRSQQKKRKIVIEESEDDEERY